MAAAHNLIRGTLLYTSNKPGREGRERGREHFTIVTHADGRRTLSAHCEIDDEPSVLRDVTIAFDSRSHPTDCFVRISVNDRFTGSSWFRFTDRAIECEAWTAADGRVSQRVDLAGPVTMFGTHPIQSDGLLTALLDPAKGPRTERYPELYLCSLDHRGATGPLIMKHPTGLKLTLLGRERIAVAAGEFDSLHYQVGDNVDGITEDSANEPGKHPPYDMWTTADGHSVVLKAQVTGYMMTAYELTSYESRTVTG